MVALTQKDCSVTVQLDTQNNGKHQEEEAGVTLDHASAFSEEGKSRRMAGLRTLVAKFSGSSSAGVIGLHGGLPPQSAFPLASLSVKLVDGTVLNIDDPVKMFTAQQYPLTLKGYGPLYEWAYNHVMKLHHPPAGKHEVTVTNGNNPSVEMVLRLFLNKGDPVMVEEYTYPAIPESMCATQDFRPLPVEIDGQGIVPSALRSLLAGRVASGQPVPRLLYTVPVGQNPTGSIIPLERRKEIYSICREYNVYILEDDPYFYLQLTPPSQAPRGLRGLGQSYLSLDVDGRVVRLDTFSKMLGPGFRLGWATAAPEVIAKLVQHLQGISVGACMVSQVIVAELLEHWGEEGFEQHVTGIQRDYGQRADAVHQAALQHLAGLAEWEPPEAGMFLWLKLLVVKDAAEILDELVAQGVVVVPGNFTYGLGPRGIAECPYVRVSFSSAPLGDLREGMRRLGEVLRAHQQRDTLPSLAGAGLQLNGTGVSPKKRQLKSSVSDLQLSDAMRRDSSEHGTHARADALASGARKEAKASLVCTRKSVDL